MLFDDIFRLIFDLSNFLTKINLKTSSNIFSKYSLGKIPKKYCYLLTDEIIKNMNLHTLDASNNNKITDEGINNMKLREAIHTLHAISNNKITKK